MLAQQLALTHEQTSPLFRIMWLQNPEEPQRRHFENNICAFHIGNGFILSVAHNLRSEAKIMKSISQDIYASEILPYLNSVQAQLFDHCFVLDPGSQKRYWNSVNQHDYQMVMDILRQINFDTRWITFMEKKISTPHLIVQFKNQLFYNDSELSRHFSAKNYFAEPAINRHTYLIEVALIEAYYSEDIALYRMVNVPEEVIKAMPVLAVDFSILNDHQEHYYCLQSSPTSEIGKLLNKAQIEGFTDHFSYFQDRIGGNYTFEGLRYLIKGYFRFGSSGAPYVYYHQESQTFRVNAIQSEACPIQLSIENKRDGNFQYVNAIASPLHIIKDSLEKHLSISV